MFSFIILMKSVISSNRAVVYWMQVLMKGYKITPFFELIRSSG